MLRLVAMESLAHVKQDHENFQQAFSVEKGGYSPASNWYKANLRNINEEDDKGMHRLKLRHRCVVLTFGGGIPKTAYTLNHPTLLVASTDYFITITVNFAAQMQPLVPDLKVETVKGGHWLQLEKADEVNKILGEFVEGKE